MNSLRSFVCVAIVGSALSVAITPLQAAEPEVQLAIKAHRFEPAELKVPAGQRIRLVVHNQDPTPEEFESHSLNREKVIPGGSRATIYIGPLKPGRYSFFDEFHTELPAGVIEAR